MRQIRQNRQAKTIKTNKLKKKLHEIAALVRLNGFKNAFTINFEHFPEKFPKWEMYPSKKR
jgi:hypothetical protein